MPQTAAILLAVAIERNDDRTDDRACAGHALKGMIGERMNISCFELCCFRNVVWGSSG
jgi:hypothetical protein